MQCTLYFCSFSTIYKCWKLSPDDRPSFEALSSAICGSLQAVAGYMEVQMVLMINSWHTCICIFHSQGVINSWHTVLSGV